MSVATLRIRGDETRPPMPAAADDRMIVHALNRIAYGPRPGDLERVRTIGVSAYIDRQLHPERIPDDGMNERLGSFAALRMSARELAEHFFIPAMQARKAVKSGREPSAPDTDAIDARRQQRVPLDQLSQQKVLRAVFSERQLEEVMTDFWFNHFNVFAGKSATAVYLVEYERDAIRPHALGRFRDLLHATATSPAMLFYLDNWLNAGPAAAEHRDARPRFGERGAALPRPRRGLNENYARELMELHTLGVDGGYTEHDVVEVARAFTGWTISTPRQGGGFRFDRRLHDAGDKTVLGHRIHGGSGQADGERVLDILADHPSTARFIASKLARRFVADTPPPALVARAAARFRATHGDIREVLRTILLSPEFGAGAAYRAKVKTPFEFVVSSIRATGSDITSALSVAQAVHTLGMPLYFCLPPTGYTDDASGWMHAGALVARMNFALSLAAGTIRGLSTPETADVTTTTALAGDLSTATVVAIAKAGDRRQALALTLGSPEFQRR